MEAVGLLGILGLGYAVANLSSNTKSMGDPPISVKKKDSQQANVQEMFQDSARPVGPPKASLTLMPKGGSCHWSQTRTSSVLQNSWRPESTK
jgi:hypothetical protein